MKKTPLGMILNPLTRRRRFSIPCPTYRSLIEWGKRPCYSPSLDVVGLPELEKFVSSERFYKTVFHELTHSTAHVGRLNRSSIMNFNAFGSHEYSREELIAEFGASFLCAEAGIVQSVIENAAAYIDGWSAVSQKDRKIIIYADADGVTKEFWYDRKGRKVREDHNGVTVNTIVRDGRTSWNTDAEGNVTRREMDEHYNLTRIVYPDTTWVEYEYSQPWNRLVKQNRMGLITAYEYDADGYLSARVEAQGAPVERRTEFTWSATGKLRTVTLVNTAGADAITTYTYDDHDNLVTVTDPEGRITRFSDYDSSGNPHTMEDGRGYQKHFEYDAAGHLRFVRDQNNELLSEIRYDEAGNRAGIINALLKEFKFSYDTNGRLLETEDPYGNKRSTRYTPAGRVTLVEDEEHVKIRREYDDFGRPARIIDEAGNEISYEYLGSDCSSCGSGSDMVSRIIFPTHTREFEYDSRGRVVVRRDVLSETEERVTRMTYDDFGNPATLTDPSGRVTTYAYDELNRKTSETNALNEVTRFTYDFEGNLTRLEDPNNGFTYFVYDRTGRLLKESKPLQQETTYSYDNNGNLKTVTDADGRKTVHSYDPLNRLVKTEFFVSASATEPSRTIVYTYNKVGSLTGYDDAVTSATYGYDDLQRRISETVHYPGFDLSSGYAWYKNGRKKSYTGPSGLTRTWSYDQAGRFTGLDLGDAGEMSVNSYVWNQPAKMTLPGGSTLNLSYNGLQEPTRLTHRDPGGNPALDHGYSYSPSGQITALTTGHGNYGFEYDDANRLTAVQSPSAQESFTYDPLGNRLSSSGQNNWSYDDNNRLQSYGNASFTYDARGNMTGRTVNGSTRAFTYTVDNRLQKVEDDGAVVGSYYYDPFGRRLWKDVGGTRTCFHYNDEGLAGEYDASGNELRTYGYHAGSSWSSNPLFVRQGGVYYWYLNDHLGTPQKIIAENGQVVWSAQYTAFGRATVDVETIENNLRFPGQYFDAETGLHQNGYRYYDPSTGRYLTADPIGLDGGINLYAYVSNDPVNFVDPDGLARITGIGTDPIYVHPNDVDPNPSKPHGHVGSPNSKVKVDSNTGKIYKNGKYTGKKLTKKQLKKFRAALKGRGLLSAPLLLMFEWQIECLNNPTKCSPDYCGEDQT